MRPVAAPGRWVWGVSGLATVAVLAIPGTHLILHAGVPGGIDAGPQATVIRTVTVSQPVTRLDVQSYGAPVKVTAGPVGRVRVTETITYNSKDAASPAVTQSVSGGQLTLADPVCNTSDCAVGFAVTVPPGVTVTAASQGGPVTVSGVARTDLDSGGGPVSATGIDGPLTVSTEGGPLILNGLTGSLHADTAGGSLLAQGVNAGAATVITGGGQARVVFAAAPDTALVSSDGGPALVGVPGGPYALTADSDGGPMIVRIATDPAARRSITVTSGGGPLVIEPSGANGP